MHSKLFYENLIGKHALGQQEPHAATARDQQRNQRVESHLRHRHG